MPTKPLNLSILVHKTWIIFTTCLIVKISTDVNFLETYNDDFLCCFFLVYLNGSITNEMKMRGFVGFIIYAENSVPEYANGHFVNESLPPGVEVVNCSNLLVSYILPLLFYKGHQNK